MGGINESGVTDEGFAGRFAGLLIRTRLDAKCSCKTLAQRSGGRFGVAELHSFERGDHLLSVELVATISQLYGAQLESILGAEHDVRISGGLMKVGDASSEFTEGDPTSMLSTYLRLVRGLRNQQPANSVELRHDDVERLAEHMHVSGEAVVDQLAALMHTTRGQRRSMVGLFASGALVIAVVASLSAGGTALASSTDAAAPAGVVANRITTPWLMLPPDAVFPAPTAPVVVHVRHASPTRTSRPTVAAPAPINTGIDDSGALVATDLGTGDGGIAPTATSTPINTGIDDSGALVATDLGTGDGGVAVPHDDNAAGTATAAVGG
jgi:hypothetical protein